MKIWEYLRKNKKVQSKKEFADEIGISMKMLAAIQNGSDMRFSIGFKIVQASNGEVTFQDLYDGISEKG